MKDIHTIAEGYLRDLERGHAHFYAPASTKTVVPLGESLTQRVVIMRETEPHYLVGIKPSGRPIFTHDMRLAASYDSASLKLVEVLAHFKKIDLYVETMPACWFSNHQPEDD